MTRLYGANFALILMESRAAVSSPRKARRRRWSYRFRGTPQSRGEVIDLIGTRSNLGESRWMTAPHMPAKITSQSKSAPKSLAQLRRAALPASGGSARQRRTSAPLIIAPPLFFIADSLSRNSSVTARAVTLFRINCGLMKMMISDRVLVLLVLPSKSPRN